ncbi:hypothetical protein PMAYCL1PPCAC_22595, partial [Pristionchus mayeri]
LVRVEDLEIQHSIQLQLHIVQRINTLWVDVNRLLLQRLHVLDLIDARNQNVHSGFEHFVESAHAFNYPCLLLRNEVDDGVARHLK